MSDKNTVNSLMTPEHWRRFFALSDTQIDAAIASDPDTQAFPDDFLRDVEVVRPHATEKVTVDLDEDVLRILQSSGLSYQDVISGLLHDYVRLLQTTSSTHG